MQRPEKPLEITSPTDEEVCFTPERKVTCDGCGDSLCSADEVIEEDGYFYCEGCTSQWIHPYQIRSTIKLGIMALLLCLAALLSVSTVTAHHSPDHEGEGPQLLFNDATGELYPRPGDEQYFVQRDDGNWYYTDAYYDEFFTDVEYEPEEQEPVDEMATEEPDEDAPVEAELPSIEPPTDEDEMEEEPREEESDKGMCVPFLEEDFINALLANLDHFTLELNAGWNLVHLPLDVFLVDDNFALIDTLGDVAKVFGFDNLFRYDADGRWRMVDEDSMETIAPYEGFVVQVDSAMTFELYGFPVSHQMPLMEGNNFVGIPRDNGQTVGELLASSDIITSILVEDEGTFYYVQTPDDAGADVPIQGGQAYGIVSTESVSRWIGGAKWSD